MDKSKITKYYRTFKELIKILHANEDIENIKKLNDTIENHFEDIITGLLFNRFNSNLNNKKSRNGTTISFLMSEVSVEKSIILPSLLTQTKDKIKRKLKKIMEEIPVFNSSTYLSSSVFKTNIPLEPYAKASKNYLFYYSGEKEEVYENYVLLYQEHIIQALERLYLKPNINRQINLDNLQICSIDNFKKINTMDTIAFANRQKLINKLTLGVQEDRRLLTESDVLLCYKARIIHDMIAYSPEHNEKPVEEEPKEKDFSFSIDDMEEKREEEIKINISKLLRSSVRQKDYSGFFTKDDYINFLCDKYFDRDRYYIEGLFDKVTSPRPPVGVTRFSIRLEDNRELVYFISLDNVVPLFISYDFSTEKKKKKKKQDITSLTISERHFLLLLRRLLKDFRKLGYSNKLISDKLKCSEKTIELMDDTVSLL